MADFVNQPSMAAGEIGPELYGRVDQDLYGIGMRKVLNFLIFQYGGAGNRMGTKIVSESKINSRKTRLIPFIFNDTQQYALEFGHLYMRIIKDGAEVLETAKVITGITKANPGVVTSVAHGLSNGNDVYLASIVGMVELNGRTVRIANVAADTFELTDLDGNNINTTNYTTYGSAGTAARIYTVTTTYDESDLFELGYTQSNDVMTILHNDYYPRDVTRTAHNAWTIANFANTGGPFLDINGTATTVYASAATGSGVTLTASAALFSSGMVGELFYMEQEPVNITSSWEAGKFVASADYRRSGTNYYQAATFSTAKTITAITAANPPVVTTSTAHGRASGDLVRIASVVGMTQVNDNYYSIKVLSATTFSLYDKDNNSTSIDGSAYTAYISGGTSSETRKTGNIKPAHTEGTLVDGDPGIAWTYLHSGFGIAQITGYTNTTTVTATIINTLPSTVVGSGNPTTNWAKSAWSATNGYPAAAAYHKGRMEFGGETNQPNALEMSNVGLRSIFNQGNPVLDDESIRILMDTANGSGAIRHLIPMKQLIVMTASSELMVDGVNHVLKATELPTAETQGYTGCSKLKPLVIGNTVLFQPDIGSEVRSFQYQLDTDSFGGINLAARSPHLFRGKKIIDWSYQRHPFSIIWCIFDDGTMAAFTFVNEQKVYAFAPQETLGEFESTCSIREGDETATYLSVKRTINGHTKRFTERFATRIFDSVRDAYFMDCGLTYDGRNTGATTMTISGGTAWDSGETLTLTASTASTFKSSDVGTGQIVFWGENTDGSAVAYRLNITAYTSGTVVSVVPTKTIPVAYRTVARTDWEFGRTTFFPLNHLEGEDVAVLADGNVVNDLTVSSGRVTLTDPAAVVHIGLPYTCDLETLDLAIAGGQLKAKTVAVPRVFLTVQESSSFKIGNNGFENVKPLKRRLPSDGYDAPVPLATDLFPFQLNTSWSNKGRIAIRQTDPLPVTINCITPEVVIGYD